MNLINIPHKQLVDKLTGYLENDNRLKAVFECIRQRLDSAKLLASRNWKHAYRDTINAILLIYPSSSMCSNEPVTAHRLV